MSDVPELWWGTPHRKGRVLEADPEGGYWVHTLTDGNHVDTLPTDAVRLAPVAPVGNVDRETLALAFMRANVIPTVDADGSTYLDTPDHPEARRLADVALAALQGES